MCQCGSKRSEFVQSKKDTFFAPGHVNVPSKMWSDVSFRYKGKSSLTAVGSITGRRYFFKKSGDILIIDYRDANGMRTIPNLEKITSMTK